MESKALEYLRQLVSLTGVSGVEGDVVREVVRLVRPLVDSVEVDAFGNVLAVRQAASPQARSCMLAAHMDEVGFRIRHIEESGFLRFEKVGGTDNRVCLAQRVWVGTPMGRVLGLIGTKSAHLSTDADRAAVPAHTDLYIDIGARDGGAARDMGILLGAPVGFVGELAEVGIGTGRYTAHALDDRVGCAVLLALLDDLQGERLQTMIVAAFTVQEEVGLRGAQTAIRGHACDVAIAVDTTAVDDTPEFGSTGNSHLRLGGGAAVKIMDFSLLAHPAVQRGLRAAAGNAGVEMQEEILMRIGTDAGALQFGGTGIPAGTLSIGTRYTHSPIELLDGRDLDDAVRLLRHFVKGLPELDLRFVALDDVDGGA